MLGSGLFMPKPTVEQQKKLVFLHHALWSLAKDLSQNDALLIAQIGELRNAIDNLGYLKGVNENMYCRYVDKGGILLLNDVVL